MEGDSMSIAQKIQLPDGSIVNLLGGSKEWQLFQTVTADEETVSFSWDGLDFTEFLFVATGLKNRTATDSSVAIAINESTVATLSSKKNSDSNNNRNEVVHIKYNGLFWENFKGGQSNNAADYYTSYGTASMPYAFRTNIGKCAKLTIASNSPAYQWSSGTIQIYAR